MIVEKVEGWLADPEGGRKSVVDMFFVIGLSVLFAGFWIVVYRKVFGSKILG